MGSYNSKFGLIFIFYVISLPSLWVHCENVQDLDDLISTYVDRTDPIRRTGSLYKIKLPANLSGVEAYVVTLRNSMFWKTGANFSHFYIPPMVKTTPYAKRLALLCENLGNLSPRYFRAAGYSFVSPVVGFSAYDATNPNDMGNQKLKFSILGNNVISIRFDPYVTHVGKKEILVKCVAFVDANNNGSFELSNMTRNHECVTTSSSGHFALVVPSSKPSHSRVKLKWWWWYAAAAAGAIAVVAVMAVVAAKLVRKKRMREMEIVSENGEPVGHVWIGQSRMPAAAMMRTQPSLEHHDDDVPSAKSSSFL